VTTNALLPSAILWFGCLSLCVWYTRAMGLIELLVVILLVLIIFAAVGRSRW